MADKPKKKQEGSVLQTIGRIQAAQALIEYLAALDELTDSKEIQQFVLAAELSQAGKLPSLEVAQHIDTLRNGITTAMTVAFNNTTSSDIEEVCEMLTKLGYEVTVINLSVFAVTIKTRNLTISRNLTAERMK